MAPPAINLDQPFIAGTSSKINHHNSHSIARAQTTTSKSSEEEERESTDGAVDELAVGANSLSGKRPRGRPPGSKNKPKIPTYLSVDPQDALRSHVMEIASGADISSSLAAYARSRGRGVSILHAAGSVAGVTFRQHDNPSLFLKGKLDIISLSGTVLPDNTSMGPTGLTVFVSGPHGQVMGGPVEGRLVAAGTVMLMAATFSTATYEKLPLQMDPPAAATSDGLRGSGPLGPPLDADFHPENASYAWFLQQQQQQQHNQDTDNSNNRPLYINN